MDRKHNINISTTNASNASANPNEGSNGKPIIRSTPNPAVLYIEPFYGGSHKQLIDVLIENTSHTFIGMSGKKWPWRARCSALILSQCIPAITTEKTLFCSSVLNLAELLGLRSDLIDLKKIVYFHENQFVYPIRQIKDRDIQYPYNEILTCLAADIIVFNSNFNMTSLLENLNKIIKLFPDYRPKNLVDTIRPKCQVLYFPVDLPQLHFSRNEDYSCVKIVWPHRWEFDKDPHAFLQVLLKLKQNGYNFKVHILGEVFKDIPDIFSRAKVELQENILSFGYAATKEKYYEILCDSHVAVSTAIHEFFGVSMLESALCSCVPLVPNRLVYPEIYPKDCLYEDENELYQRLEMFCLNPQLVLEKKAQLKIDFEKYSIVSLLPKYINLI